MESFGVALYMGSNAKPISGIHCVYKLLVVGLKALLIDEDIITKNKKNFRIMVFWKFSN